MVVGFMTTYAITIIKIKSNFYNFDHKYQYEIKIISKKNSGKQCFKNGSKKDVNKNGSKKDVNKNWSKKDVNKNWSKKM
jgi:hypothetical protein